MTKNGFTLLEVLIASTIATIMGLAIIGASILLMRGTDETTQRMSTQQQFDMIVYNIYNLLINTDRDHITQIIAENTNPDAIGSGIVFQVPTADTTGSFTSSSGSFLWGDGQVIDNYIRIRQDDNGDIVFERVDDPDSTNPIESRILIKNCTMQVRGAFINNDNQLEYNNTAPSILDIVFEKAKKYFDQHSYRKHLHVSLRVH